MGGAVSCRHSSACLRALSVLLIILPTLFHVAGTPAIIGKLLSTRHPLVQLFNEVDTNGNGKLDAQELHAFLEHVHETHVQDSRPTQGTSRAFSCSQGARQR